MNNAKILLLLISLLSCYGSFGQEQDYIVFKKDNFFVSQNDRRIPILVIATSYESAKPFIDTLNQVEYMLNTLIILDEEDFNTVSNSITLFYKEDFGNDQNKYGYFDLEIKNDSLGFHQSLSKKMAGLLFEKLKLQAFEKLKEKYKVTLISYADLIIDKCK